MVGEGVTVPMRIRFMNLESTTGRRATRRSSRTPGSSIRTTATSCTTSSTAGGAQELLTGPGDGAPPQFLPAGKGMAEAPDSSPPREDSAVEATATGGQVERRGLAARLRSQRHRACQLGPGEPGAGRRAEARSRRWNGATGHGLPPASRSARAPPADLDGGWQPAASPPRPRFSWPIWTQPAIGERRRFPCFCGSGAALARPAGPRPPGRSRGRQRFGPILAPGLRAGRDRGAAARAAVASVTAGPASPPSHAGACRRRGMAWALMAGLTNWAGRRGRGSAGGGSRPPRRSTPARLRVAYAYHYRRLAEADRSGLERRRGSRSGCRGVIASGSIAAPAGPVAGASAPRRRRRSPRSARPPRQGAVGTGQGGSGWQFGAQDAARIVPSWCMRMCRTCRC